MNKHWPHNTKRGNRARKPKTSREYFQDSDFESVETVIEFVKNFPFDSSKEDEEQRQYVLDQLRERDARNPNVDPMSLFEQVLLDSLAHFNIP